VHGRAIHEPTMHVRAIYEPAVHAGAIDEPAPPMTECSS
jgi:hypothetical protein